MAMSPFILAEDMRSKMNKPFPASLELIGLSVGIVSALQNATATFGNIQTPHSISGIDPKAMASDIASKSLFPGISNELIAMCTGIATYLEDNAIVTYAGPAPSPPAIPPSAAWNTGGTILNIDKDGLASQLQISMGQPAVTSDLIGMSDAITNHLLVFAEVNNGVIN